MLSLLCSPLLQIPVLSSVIFGFYQRMSVCLCIHNSFCLSIGVCGFCACGHVPVCVRERERVWCTWISLESCGPSHVKFFHFKSFKRSFIGNIMEVMSACYKKNSELIKEVLTCYIKNATWMESQVCQKASSKSSSPFNLEVLRILSGN